MQSVSWSGLQPKISPQLRCSHLMSSRLSQLVRRQHADTLPNPLPQCKTGAFAVPISSRNWHSRLGVDLPDLPASGSMWPPWQKQPYTPTRTHSGSCNASTRARFFARRLKQYISFRNTRLCILTLSPQMHKGSHVTLGLPCTQHICLVAGKALQTPCERGMVSEKN